MQSLCYNVENAAHFDKVMVSAIGHKQQVLDAIKLGAKSYGSSPSKESDFLI
jgi:DNA-binding NarL/FixJ family response regulator